MKLIPAFLLAILSSAVAGAQTPVVLFRLDDVGMNQSVNRAVEKVAATGMPISVSLLVVAPRFWEAVDILKKNPHVSVGVHLALNAEWRGYRWGPALGKGAVPTLVDSSGSFRPSVEGFLASRYDLTEVEREITAQIEKALSSGLKISYVDAHMRTLESTPQLREVLERVARNYGLGVSRRYAESYRTLWSVPPASKKSTLLSHIAGLKSNSLNLIVLHVAERTPEMEGLFDLNASEQNASGASVAAHRGAELDAILSSELAGLVSAGKIRLTTYDQVIARRPLKDTVVLFAQVARDLTGDGRPEVLKLTGTGPTIYNLRPVLTIEDAGQVIFTDHFGPVTRRVGFDGSIELRSEAEHRQFLLEYGGWIFDPAKFSSPAEFRRQMRSNYAHDPPDIPPLVNRETWGEIASSNAVVFSYSRGGDNAEAIVWVQSRKTFVRLIDCC